MAQYSYNTAPQPLYSAKITISTPSASPCEVQDVRSNPNATEFKPCAVPQLDGLRFGGPNINPFARAYAPALATYGITQREFLHMATGVAGMALTAEPFLIGPALGATSLAATGASAVVTIQRSRSYLKAWNEKLFNPVGLQVKILKTDKLMPILGYTGDNAWERHERSIQGWEKAEMDSGNDKPPEDIRSDVQKSLRRKMELLEPYVMPLNFDVEVPVGMEE
ncbi:hypothetical protein BDW59DRAFT_159271 [Aspergillus cavernicola]|uniref:SMODS and SLOG-associating 2TM effector domain-containing protein n=1 Tax=Aspergillus cavernicola TaxID=176166 RepID=A0ABR4IND8_9EURO